MVESRFVGACKPDHTVMVNSSQHNQVRKAHRNGIKKPKTNKYPSLRGVDPKFVRNQRYAKHGTEKALKAARAKA
ncbi:hypothetical protein NDA18_003577 [Ustilago nuda]|nr:hypothetical protein NDA18_003577 [Ustilago nuda]